MVVAATMMPLVVLCPKARDLSRIPDLVARGKNPGIELSVEFYYGKCGSRARLNLHPSLRIHSVKSEDEGPLQTMRATPPTTAFALLVWLL